MSISMLVFFSHQAIGFQPGRLHGTTVGHGARNHNITTSFSQQIADAWKEATESDKAVIAAEGTGHHI